MNTLRCIKLNFHRNLIITMAVQTLKAMLGEDFDVYNESWFMRESRGLRGAMSADEFKSNLLSTYDGLKDVQYIFQHHRCGLLMLCESDDKEWFGVISRTDFARKINKLLLELAVDAEKIKRTINIDTSH